jgi:DNA repair protein RadC
MHKQAPNPHQTALEIELDALEMPPTAAAGDQVKEPTTLTIRVPQLVPVYTVTLQRSDLVSLRNRAMIRCPGDAATLLWDRLKDADREIFLVLLLDTKNAVIGINTVSIGILDSALVHPREVFKPASIANAAAILLAHNHPSGAPRSA